MEALHPLLEKLFAARAYARTAAYDAEIATWFSEELNISNS
jgi:AICAR transformylase/IMP cyclohydrolase PurH